MVGEIPQTPSFHYGQMLLELMPMGVMYIMIGGMERITMPVDMSDYVITSASISAVANATVHADDGTGDPDSNPDIGGIEIPGDAVAGGTQYATYDYVKFYVLVSDVY